MPLTPIVVSSIFICAAFGPVPDSKGVKRDARQNDDFRSGPVYQLRSMTRQGRSRLFRERTRDTDNNYPAASCGAEC